MSSVLRLLFCGALVACACAVLAQDTGPVHPAPYVPSPPATADEMLRLGAVSATDIVYDLGSGDGRVVIAAAKKFGARGVGIELDARLVALGRSNAERAGVGDRVRFAQQDLFQTELGEATVIMLYLSPNLNLRLRPALLRLRPGTRIVSHASDLGDWKPDRKSAIRKDVRLWFVPAVVSGRWRGRIAARAFAVEFVPRYQEISARWLGAASAFVRSKRDAWRHADPGLGAATRIRPSRFRHRRRGGYRRRGEPLLRGHREGNVDRGHGYARGRQRPARRSMASREKIGTYPIF